MTKLEALKLAKGSVNELARILDISHAAISQWDDKKIPLLREYQINEINADRVAALNTGRKFIGIELDANYFAIAQDRIAKAQAALL